MFALQILAGISELAEYYRNDLARLRLIARDTAVAVELWIRCRYGTWRFFQITHSAIVEIIARGNGWSQGRRLRTWPGSQPGNRKGQPRLRRRTSISPLPMGE